MLVIAFIGFILVGLVSHVNSPAVWQMRDVQQSGCLSDMRFSTVRLFAGYASYLYLGRMPAKTLTPEQLEDAARLSALFKEWQRARKDAREPSSQIDAAHELGFGQSALSQYLRGEIPLNIEAAIKFSRLLGKRMEDFSPALAKKFVELTSNADVVFVVDRGNTSIGELKHQAGRQGLQTTKGDVQTGQQIELPGDLPDYVLSAIVAVLDAYHNASPREVFDGISALLTLKNQLHTGSRKKSVKDERGMRRPPTSRLTDEANRAKDATKTHLATRSGGEGAKKIQRKRPGRFKDH